MSITGAFEGKGNDWIAHGIPGCLIVDNHAEFSSVLLEEACRRLGILLKSADDLNKGETSKEGQETNEDNVSDEKSVKDNEL